MAKVGRFVSDPTAGSYCQITFESGEKIVISHDKGGFKGGRLSIEVSKLLGLRSMRIFDLDLDSTEGKSALAQLTRDAQPRIPLELLSSETFETGVLNVSYAPAETEASRPR